jgi:hypothetical protein
MLYVDYYFDLNDNMILFDKELKLHGHDNENSWGNLPEGWKEGDLWRLMLDANGKVCMMRIKDSASNI